MTLAELRTQLLTLGKPVAYSRFPAAQAPPFIVYHETGSDDFKADNRNYAKIRDVSIEMYSAAKDQTLEGQLETLLDGLSMPYTRTCVWIESEKMFETTYFVQLIGG